MGNLDLGLATALAVCIATCIVGAICFILLARRKP